MVFLKMRSNWCGRHQIRALILKQFDDASSSTNHCIFSNRVDWNEFVEPQWVHCIEDCRDWFDIVDSCVAFKKWNENQMKIYQIPFETHSSPLIEHRNPEMSWSIRRQSKCTHIWINDHVDNHFKSNNNEDADEPMNRLTMWSLKPASLWFL